MKRCGVMESVELKVSLMEPAGTPGCDSVCESVNVEILTWPQAPQLSLSCFLAFLIGHLSIVVVRCVSKGIVCMQVGTQ